MSCTGRRLVLVTACLGLVVLSAGAQSVEVTRNVKLRPTPSTQQTSLRTLRPPDEADLLETAQVNGYYHVRTDADEVGWVYARNVMIVADTAGPPVPAESTLVITGSSGTPSAAISAAWAKPAPNKTTFTSHGVMCGNGGNGGDTETNLLKNRSDTVVSYHAVAFDAIANLPYPKAGKHRHDWPQPQLDSIAVYEGVAVVVIGYLVALKPQNNGSGESTNCNMTGADETDWHMALVKAVGDGEATSIVVETTPRVRRKHPGWTTATVRRYVDTDTPLRISGWLMLDPEHRNHLNRYRSTLWEIHPITRIEVFDGTQWVSLDTP